MAVIRNSRPVASRLKAIRNQKGWTLEEVARRSGISKATLSKLENDRTNLTFTTVAKLSEGLNIPISELTNPAHIEEGSRRSVSRAADGATFEANDVRWQILCNDLSGHDQLYLRATVLRHEPDEESPWRRHPGQEFIYVLSGCLVLFTEAYEPLTLDTGDSIAFDSSMGHKYMSAGDADAVLLMSMQATGYTDVEEPSY